jgi:hypothetical protein
MRTSVGKDVEKRKPSHTVGGHTECYSHYGKHCGVFHNDALMCPQNIKNETHI